MFPKAKEVLIDAERPGQDLGEEQNGQPREIQIGRLDGLLAVVHVIETQGAGHGDGLGAVHFRRAEDPVRGFRRRVGQRNGEIGTAAFLLERVIDGRAPDRFQEVLEDVRRIGLIEGHLLLRPEQAAAVIGGDGQAPEVPRDPLADLGIADLVAQVLQEMEDLDLAVVIGEARRPLLGQGIDLDVVPKIGVDALVFQRIVLDGLVGPLQDGVAEGTGRHDDVPALLPDLSQGADGGREADDLLLGQRILRAAAGPTLGLDEIDVQPPHRLPGGDVQGGGLLLERASRIIVEFHAPYLFREFTEDGDHDLLRKLLGQLR